MSAFVKGSEKIMSAKQEGADLHALFSDCFFLQKKLAFSQFIKVSNHGGDPFFIGF